MSKSSRHKEKYGHGHELPMDNFNEETAARTRPFSYEEIMLRRKKKKETAGAKELADEPENVSGKGNVEGVPGVVKQASEDTGKRSSRKREGNTNLEENKIVGGKDKESRDLITNLKTKLNKDMTSRAHSVKDEKRSHHRSRNSERSRDDFDNASHKRSSKESTRKEKYGDRGKEKSERETKRKHRNGNDEKNRSDIDLSAVRRHDSGKRHDSEPSEKKGRKESSQYRHEEANSKRRRSRSREYDRDRDRRSSSHSPRGHKHTSYHGRDSGESSFHSSKDRSGRKHSDVDRNKMSSNGGHASSDQRRLGGYSPRKRKTEAAVKTPSPTIRSPERKSAGWDLPPATESKSVSSMFNNLQLSGQTIPSDAFELPAAVTTVRPLSGASTVSVTMNPTVESIQLTQATRPLRRLYIENVPASASDKAIVECLNDFLLSSAANHIRGTQPCISCIINQDKGQALVEFLTPADATAALAFDGRSFSGSVLKLRRPKVFNESATGVSEKPAATVNAVSDVVMDSPDKIFIGGFPKTVSSEMLMEIAGAFGVLKAFHFQVNDERSEPCAFLEYMDQSITTKACAGLSGMKLGGKVLTVVQSLPNASREENTEKPPFYGIPEHARPLLEKPTQVLELKNVFNQEELSSLSGPELEETLEDIRLECARFGTVKSINIVKYRSDTTPETLEVTDQTVTKKASQEPEVDDNTRTIETMEEDHDPNSSENIGSEPLNDVNDDKIVSEYVENDLSCDLNTEGTPQDALNRVDTSKDQFSNNDDMGNDVVNSAMESSTANNLIVEEEIRLEEVSGELREVSVEMVNNEVEKESKGAEKQESEEGGKLDGIFEGSVLVEFMRAEASCMAAHCLHGRLYGDEIVSVRYVSHDLYLGKYPK